MSATDAAAMNGPALGSCGQSAIPIASTTGASQLIGQKTIEEVHQKMMTTHNK